MPSPEPVIIHSLNIRPEGPRRRHFYSPAPPPQPPHEEPRCEHGLCLCSVCNRPGERNSGSYDPVSNLPRKGREEKP